MPRIIGLLSWYAEDPRWLDRCIQTYAEAGITNLVAVDGAYALYPDGQPSSPAYQHDYIAHACARNGVRLKLHVPEQTWQGNEIEKRSAMFALAEQIAQPGVDWYLVIDADETVRVALTGWIAELECTSLDCADVALCELEPQHTAEQAQINRTKYIDPASRGPIRKLFRAIPGLRCHNNHYTYRTPDDRDLWGDMVSRLAPALDLTPMIEIDHWTKYRSVHRHAQSHKYYARRKSLGVEQAA